MDMDRRTEPRGDERRCVPRYTISTLSAAIAGSLMPLTVTDIGEVNIKMENVFGFPDLNEAVEIILTVPFLDTIATIPIHGTVTRSNVDEVVVTYSHPSKTWEYVLSVLNRVVQ